jgi:hypothetical protein
MELYKAMCRLDQIGFSYVLAPWLQSQNLSTWSKNLYFPQLFYSKKPHFQVLGLYARHLSSKDNLILIPAVSWWI